MSPRMHLSGTTSLQRRQVLAVLMPLLLTGGLLSFLLGGSPAALSQRSQPWVLLGWSLFVLGAAAGAALMFHLRRDSRELIDAISQMSGGRRISPLVTDNPDLRPLTTAINDLVDSCGRGVSDAHLRAKELEIQLKVATAERQHAEAIIYSISDAVLVTDTFDELVLANESAARTFHFDLDGLRRAPVSQIVQDQKLVELI